MGGDELARLVNKLLVDEVEEDADMTREEEEEHDGETPTVASNKPIETISITSPCKVLGVLMKARKSNATFPPVTKALSHRQSQLPSTTVSNSEEVIGSLDMSNQLVSSIPGKRDNKPDTASNAEVMVSLDLSELSDSPIPGFQLDVEDQETRY